MRGEIILILWIAFLIVLCITLAGVYFWFLRRPPTEEHAKIIIDIIFSLVLEAEKQLGGKTGQAKFALVVRDFMRECPAWLQKFVTTEMLTEWINEAVERMKNYLAANRAAERVFMGGDS